MIFSMLPLPKSKLFHKSGTTVTLKAQDQKSRLLMD